jgi:hypothetical protein
MRVVVSAGTVCLGKARLRLQCMHNGLSVGVGAVQGRY